MPSIIDNLLGTLFFSEYCLVPLKTGKFLLRMGHHTYSTNDKDISKKTHWYCSKRISKKCRASVKMFDGMILYTADEHTHD